MGTQQREWSQQQNQHSHRERDAHHRSKEPDEELIEHLPLQQSDTMSSFSDETQTVDLNQQLLRVIKTDNNTSLVQWLRESHGYQLMSEVDERLMVSLIYRITQLLKVKTYTNDIVIFLKKEFVLGSIGRNSFSLPSPLKSEFLSALAEIESIQEFTPNIMNALE